jgi:hypothetical protein
VGLEIPPSKSSANGGGLRYTKTNDNLSKIREVELRRAKHCVLRKRVTVLGMACGAAKPTKPV